MPRDGPWEIIGAKTAGVTMGFRIRDAAGRVWLLKFDPPDHPGQSIRAGVVSNLILHACGYNTPVDRVAIFDRDQLTVGTDARLRPVRGGAEVVLTEANLDSVLLATNSVFQGRYHALASRYLDGIPLGPIRHQGTRPDDPNDLVPHQHRREWRALRVFCAWIGHVDTKIQNTLAVYEGEPGRGHVAHYLIDFASTLGTSGAQQFAKFNFEYGVDVPASVGRLVTLGLRQADVADHALAHAPGRGRVSSIPRPSIPRRGSRSTPTAPSPTSPTRTATGRPRSSRPSPTATCGSWWSRDGSRTRAPSTGWSSTWARGGTPSPAPGSSRWPPSTTGSGWTAGSVGRDLGLERLAYGRRDPLPGPAPFGRCPASRREMVGLATPGRPRLDRPPSVRGHGLIVSWPSSSRSTRGEGWLEPVTVYVGPRSQQVVAVDR